MKIRFEVAVLTPLALIAVAFCTQSQAATFNIANGDVAAFRNAINTCNSNSQNDTINLAANGSYVFTDAYPGSLNTSALPDIGYDGNHSVTINGNNATLARSSAAGTPAFRLVSFFNSSGTISNLTLTNGQNGLLTNSSNVVLNNCTIANNSGSNGGGISNDNGTLQLNNCTLSGNSASGFGGAIYNGPAQGASAILTITNCTFSGNSAANGGGTLYNFNSDVESNPNTDAIVTIHNCTINGGGIFNLGNSGVATIYLGNNILSNCALTKVFPSSKIISEGYNITDGTGGGFLTNSGDLTNTNPGLDPDGLKFNGGNTQTIALVAGSAAIDRGYAFGVATDQRGSPRPVDNPAVPNTNDGSDIGAFESAADPTQSGVGGFVVTTTDDHDDGVAGGNDCTLREALARTNASSSQGVIRFAPGVTGTITLHSGLVISRPVSIQGPGARLLTINGFTNYRVFYVTGIGTTTISGLTIANGWDAGPSGGSAGGAGIYNTNVLNLNDCTLDFNRALGGSGSALGQSGGAAFGGGIYNAGVMTVNRCTFKNNGVFGGFGANYPPPDSFTITTGGVGGSAGGGGIMNDNGATLTMNNCTFSGNSATGATGGSGSHGGNGGSGLGGAVYNLGSLTMSSCTASGNTGSGGAGGSGQSSGFNGTAGIGAGGVTAVGSGAATLRNCLLAGNTTSGNFRNDVYGTFISQGYNLIGKTDGATGFTGTSDQTGTAAAPMNAQLAALANNGGATDTFRLLVNSPAIDKGRNFTLTTDQRGRGRPADFPTIPNASGGDGSDIGAFEVGGLIIVTTLDDHDDGSADATDCTLREAINAANANTAEDETITFAAGLAGTIQLSSQLPQITSNLNIAGPGAGVISVRRNSTDAFRIFTVTNNTTSGPVVAISGLTLSNGHALSTNFPQNCGGGILNANSNLTVDRCVITGNSDAGFPATGGGIFNYQGTLTITNSTISDNTGFSGGGIGNYRDTSGNATLTLVGCTFSGNSIGAGTGGALQNNATVPGANATANLTSCTFSGNQAPNTFGGGGTGGAIQNLVSGGASGTVNLTHCTFKNNASAGGGDIANSTSNGPATITLRNSVLNAAGVGPVLKNSGGTITSLGYNLASDAANGDGTTGPGGFLNATGDVRNTNPLLGVLADNGGPTWTHLPLTGSPVLDRGKSFGIAFDQRGLARLVDAAHFPNASGGDGTDIGAVEVNPAGSLTDNDGDGMPDEWETFYGVTDPNADADGTGQNNLFKYIAGLNPRDGSRFTLSILQVSGQPSQKQLVFQPLVSGRTYNVEYKTNLTSSSWQLLTGTTQSDSGATRTVTDTSAAARKYYHVQITKP